MLFRIFLIHLFVFLVLNNVFQIEPKLATAEQRPMVYSAFQNHQIKHDFLFSSLANEAKYRYYYYEKMKEANKKSMLESENKRHKEMEQAKELKLEQSRKLEEQIYREHLLSRVSGAVFKDFNGRFW